VLRALAVTGVLLTHSAHFDHGAAGVDLFFVISGVIIGMVAQGRTASEFIVARLTRIYPIYWFNLMPLLVPAFVFGIITPSRLATSLTLWPIWGSYAPSYLAPAWTLSFEMLFYVAMTAAIALRRVSLLVPTLAALVVLNVAIGGPYLNYIGHPMLLEFCAGFLVMNLPRNSWAGAVALVCGAGLFALSPTFPIDGAHIMDFGPSFQRVIAWGIPAALCVYGCLSLERGFGRWAAVPVFIGDASYSIYLSQFILNLVVQIWWPAKVAIMLAAGSAMYVLVERQLLKLTRATFGGGRSKLSSQSAEPLALPE
jgi:exopolysaccharide production protein ExoZ